MNEQEVSQLDRKMTSEFLKKFMKLPHTSKIALHVDRSTERDTMAVARLTRNFRTSGSIADVRIIYEGPGRRFIPVDGGVMCVRCGKMKNTLHGALKHYKKVHR